LKDNLKDKGKGVDQTPPFLVLKFHAETAIEPNSSRLRMNSYLVSIRKRFFFALAVSIFGFACAAYLCTPPRNPLISWPGQKIPRF
jgi:hypothetical protein